MEMMLMAMQCYDEANDVHNRLHHSDFQLDG